MPVCIASDKSSNAELSEAINSMFAWYEESAVCYVYMTDVHHDHECGTDADRLAKSTLPMNLNLPCNKPEWKGFEGRFRSSRYFHRGWTLQELLAPHLLQFYSTEWFLLGSRRGLAEIVAEVTSIPQALLLQQTNITAYCVPRRMSWASTRSTTRIEDEAYCLLGLFQINMPLLYGERERAFQRLQQEILRTTGDVSILAWEYEGFGRILSPLLAAGTKHFAQSRYLRTINPDRASPIALLPTGARASLPSISFDTDNGSIMLVALNCYDERSPDKVVAVLARTVSRGTLNGYKGRSVVCHNSPPRLHLFSIDQEWAYTDVHLLYEHSPQEAESPTLYVRLLEPLQELNYRLTMKNVRPPQQWNQDAIFFGPTEVVSLLLLAEPVTTSTSDVASRSQSTWEIHVFLYDRFSWNSPLQGLLAQLTCNDTAEEGGYHVFDGNCDRGHETWYCGACPQAADGGLNPCALISSNIIDSSVVFKGLGSEGQIRLHCVPHLVELGGRHRTLFISIEAPPV